jgi:hypothetical protein
MQKTTKDLVIGDVVANTDGSLLEVRAISKVQDNIYSVSYIELDTKLDVIAFEFANDKFTVKAGA